MESSTKTRLQLYEEHKSGSNCDISFGFPIKYDENDMETDQLPIIEKPARILVYAHTSVLRESSTVFAAMVPSMQIPVNELTAAQFIKFLEILYLAKVGTDIETPAEAFALYGYSSKYQCEEAVLLLTNHVVETFLGSGNKKAFFMFHESIEAIPNPLLEESCLEFASKFTQNIIESEDFLKAKPKTVEKIYKLDIMNIHNELSLVKALEKYVQHHENQGEKDIKDKLTLAIGAIRFQILGESQIAATNLLTDKEKSIFISVLKNGTQLEMLPIKFTRKSRTRYDAKYVNYSADDVFNLMMSFYICNSDDCSSPVCPTFGLAAGLDQKYHEILKKLEVLHNSYVAGGDESVVEEILPLLFELDYCLEEDDSKQKETQDNN